MADQKTGPQAFVSSYAPRLRTYVNSLMTPVLPSTATSGPISRTTKRGTTVINYAEENFDYDDDDSDDVRRRPTGLRSLRRDETTARADPSERVNKETSEPVDVPGIWRDWMSRDSLSKTQFKRSDIQNYAQAALPLTLIPIRIDLEIPAFVPPPSFPPPAHGADMSQPQYRSQEMTLPYRLKDTFLWNLHESLITTDQFAHTMVQDLDLPNKVQMAAEISKQIRTQLEEYAGVALHPLFHSPSSYADPAKQARAEAATPATPLPNDSGTPLPAANDGSDAQSRALGASSSSGVKNGVTAEAKAIPATGADADGTDSGPVDLEGLDPDDTYRCIVTLNITLASQLYTDRFEWSLLHPVGTAEAFAKQTCADLGLPAEWVPAITHAIYEAVLRLKKEACEAGGLVVGWGGGGAGGSGGPGGASGGEVPNDAAHGAEAGWRYDPDGLADEWEPKLEVLSKEELEKREGDRERQIRRLRRETARFSSTSGMLGGGGFGFGFGFGGAAAGGEADAAPGTPGADAAGERMGRGERSKKKRRFRSLSPLARSGTPGGYGRATPDVLMGYGGSGTAGSLTDAERTQWRCAHCRIWGTGVWAVRDGPTAPRSLCNNCGFIYERDRKLPLWAKNLHLQDPRPA